jgi:6-carboxyhexanoate--CoA ligase
MENQKLYSIRMRAAVGGRHELGGKHISGGEQLSTKDNILSKTAFLLEKALGHQLGEPDFLQLTIEEVVEEVQYIDPLLVTTNEVVDEVAGLKLAKSFLIAAGINEGVINHGLTELTKSSEARGAIIIDGRTGERIDGRCLKGVRVSRIDWDCCSFETWLKKHNHLQSLKVKEALALATKVAAHPYTVAELCWSDDPDYTTGYVASPIFGYQRITKLKKFGDETGGRIYFVKIPAPTDIAEYIHFLEKTPVILRINRQGQEVTKFCADT